MACIDHGKRNGLLTYNNVWWPAWGRTVGEHRVVYCAHNNVTLESISGKVIRHTCDNPRCINPEHLLLGSHKENTADMIERGRQVIQRGSETPRAKLTDEQAAYIRAHYIPGDKEFGCRALARRFGIRHSNVSRIVNNRGYSG